MIARALGRQVAVAFAIALPAAAALVALLQGLRLSPVAAAAGASGREWAAALGAIALLAIELVAPAAFGVAVVLVALRWHADGELLAARAAGISSLRLARGPGAVAAAATLLVALVAGVVAPVAARRLAASWDGLLPRALAGAVRPGAMIEVMPGLLVYAAQRTADGGLRDVVVERGDTVLAAREAHVRTAAGPELVVEARNGALRRGVLGASFSRLVFGVPVGAAVHRGVAPAEREEPYATMCRAAAPVSFALAAAAIILAAMLLAHRPGRLSLLVAGLIAARELGARVGDAGLSHLGAPMAAALPILALVLPVGALWALAARRDAW